MAPGLRDRLKIIPHYLFEEPLDAPVLLDTLTVLPGEVLVELVHRVEVHAALDFQITARGAGGHFHTRREPSHYPQTRKTL